MPSIKVNPTWLQRIEFSMNDKHLLVRQFLSFSVVGALGATVHFAVLIVAVQIFRQDPLPGSVAGFIAAAITTYILNYHFTFRSEGEHRVTFVKFLTIALIGLCLNTLIMVIMLSWFHYLFSQVIAAAVVLLWNFICNRKRSRDR